MKEDQFAMSTSNPIHQARAAVRRAIYRLARRLVLRLLQEDQVKAAIVRIVADNADLAAASYPGFIADPKLDLTPTAAERRMLAVTQDQLNKRALRVSSWSF